MSALAADAAFTAWGAYLFFAIVATVVIVLLLYEALEDDSTHERRRDERVGKTFGPTRNTQAPFVTHDSPSDPNKRHIA